MKSEKTKNYRNGKIIFRVNGSDDYLKLEIEINDFLRNVLNSVSIDEETEEEYYNGSEYEHYKRRLVKKWVFSSLYSEYKGLLFNTKLLTNKKVIYRFITSKYITKIIEDLKEMVKIIINEFLKFNNYEEEVKIVIEKK